MPDPTSLVVKKGSKMRRRTAGAHAGSVILHLDTGPGAGAVYPQHEGIAGVALIARFACSEHGLSPVLQQIQQHLLHLATIAPRLDRLIAVLALQVNFAEIVMLGQTVIVGGDLHRLVQQCAQIPPLEVQIASCD